MVRDNHHLTFRHPRGESFRALPRHGEPFSVFEWFTQNAIKALAKFPIYAVVVALLSVATWLWIVPFLEGCTWLR